MQPRLAILFWFYKEPDVCRERLILLRRLNPGVPIYGLWGGDPEAPPAELRPLMDDLYVFPEPRDGAWKWRNGDRLIAAWARERGSSLEWDTVVVVQWDMLVLAPVRSQFGMLKRDEALFSGLRPLSEVESWWGWADQPEKRRDMEAFRERVASAHGYTGPLFACLFIVICFPRAFLERYAASGPPEEGFLEYKVPTIARIFGTPVCEDHPFRPWWAADPATRGAPLRERVLNAVGRQVSPALVLRELLRPDGARVFHPYEGRLPWWLARLAPWLGRRGRRA